MLPRLGRFQIKFGMTVDFWRFLFCPIGAFFDMAIEIACTVTVDYKIWVMSFEFWLV